MDEIGYWRLETAREGSKRSGRHHAIRVQCGIIGGNCGMMDVKQPTFIIQSQQNNDKYQRQAKKK